ncbi:hypothetical protein ACUHMQ_20665 [Chitinimonas sp. PSY-7]|uniref:hypothetical protein n=1 Tax=Chitinimonas sp. PSY-7 TaxID=3459088 RepID=UPI00403FFDBB
MYDLLAQEMGNRSALPSVEGVEVAANDPDSFSHQFMPGIKTARDLVSDSGWGGVSTETLKRLADSPSLSPSNGFNRLSAAQRYVEGSDHLYGTGGPFVGVHVAAGGNPDSSVARVLGNLGSATLDFGSVYGVPKLSNPKLTVANAPDNARPSYLTSSEFAELPRTGMIDPRTIRYSQNNAKAEFKAPFGSVNEFIQGLKSGDINPATVNPVRIVQRDGKIFTLDNRRLYSFEQAGVDIPYQKLDTIPKRELFKFSTTNEGTSIVIRKGK